MPTLLCNLRLSFKSLGFKSSAFTKPALKLSLRNVIQISPTEEHACKPISMSLPGHMLESLVGVHYLQYIVSQVKAEGYHVESLSIFRYGKLKPSESIFAIERWAADSGLKVSINYDHEICFFERL